VIPPIATIGIFTFFFPHFNISIFAFLAPGLSFDLKKDPKAIYWALSLMAL
tara:strand:- start:244 stop:396 length:153 start_codon:yes stop_codon:yes gene_type:complete